MIQREKRYVEVDVRFSTEGRLRPLQIIFDKGQVYKIDKIKDICRRAADVGGVGDRYTCMIQGKERELWFEDGRWFVAAKVATKQTPRLTHKGPDTLYLLSPAVSPDTAVFLLSKKELLQCLTKTKSVFCMFSRANIRRNGSLQMSCAPFSSLSLGSGLYFFRPQFPRKNAHSLLRYFGIRSICITSLPAPGLQICF